MTLAQGPLRQPLEIRHVGGDRAFRRRIMELGLVPGTPVEIVGVAPLGDPMELLVRGCSLSIRRGEARHVTVMRAGPVERLPASAGAAATPGGACCDGNCPAPAAEAATGR